MPVEVLLFLQNNKVLLPIGFILSCSLDPETKLITPLCIVSDVIVENV